MEGSDSSDALIAIWSLFADRVSVFSIISSPAVDPLCHSTSQFMAFSATFPFILLYLNTFSFFFFQHCMSSIMMYYTFRMMFCISASMWIYILRSMRNSYTPMMKIRKKGTHSTNMQLVTTSCEFLNMYKLHDSCLLIFIISIH